MNEEEKNLVERDYEGEIRAKIIMEINKRFNEMEARIISKIEAVNSKIEGVDSELKSLRAKLYDEHNPGWRGRLMDEKKEHLKNVQKWREENQRRITEYQTHLNINYRDLTLNQIDHYKDEISKLQDCLKRNEEFIKRCSEEIEKIPNEQRYW